MNTNKKFISVITPTYNRANTLKTCYQSLAQQTLKDFEWIIIDDGSTDHTKQIVDCFIAGENLFPIKYIKKENSGKHTALNNSHDYLSSELSIILDSDDSLVDDAIETIREFWNSYEKNENICGLTFLKGYGINNIVGDKFPEDIMISNHIDLRINQEVKGDKAEVIRTSLFKKIVFPVFENEKFLGEGFLWVTLSKSYSTVYINKIIYVCDYLEGGLTKSGRVLRISCPKGGMFNSYIYLDTCFYMKKRLKAAWLYIAYGLFLNLSLNEIVNNKYKWFLIMQLPIGYLLYLVWWMKYHKKLKI